MQDEDASVISPPPFECLKGERKKEQCSILQQVSTYTTAILQLNGIHKSAMGFIVYMRGELDGKGTTSGIINADQTKRGRIKGKV